MEDSFCINPNSLAPIIMVVTTNPYMKIEKPCQLSVAMNSSVQMTLSSSEKKELFAILSILTQYTLTNSCNSYKPTNYSELLSSSFSWFFRFVFSHKNLVSASVVYIVIIIFHLHTKLILSLVVWIDRLITRNRKSPPQTDAFIEIRVSTLKVSPLKIFLKSLNNSADGPKKVSSHRQWRNIQRQGCRTTGTRSPTYQCSVTYHQGHWFLLIVGIDR